jgi:hypothetical protein
MTETWRGVVNGILYCVMSDTTPDDAAATRMARALIFEPLGYLTAAEEFSALEEAIAVGTRFSEAIPTPHSDEAIRTFLGSVLTKMDELRPWPELARRRVPPSEWRKFASIPVARIGMSYPHAGMLIGEVFQPSGERDDQKVLVLRLKSGAELAFVGPWWPDSDDVAVLLRGTQHSPQQVMSELVAVTELEPEDITLLSTESMSPE